MKPDHDLYQCYTTTSALTNGCDLALTLDWCKSYFIAHYSNFLPKNKTAHILEVGCGYGKYLKILSDMGYINTYGIDISDQQIQYAKNNLKLNNVEKADALNWLEGKDSVYDCILLFDVLEHLSNDYLMALGVKVYNALKPGGVLLVQVPNGLAPLSPFLWGDLTHTRAFTVTSMEQFLRNIGFSNFKFHEIPPHIFNCKDYIRKILWSLFFKPSIMLFLKLANGGIFGGIYTANFKIVATRDNNE